MFTTVSSIKYELIIFFFAQNFSNKATGGLFLCISRKLSKTVPRAEVIPNIFVALVRFSRYSLEASKCRVFTCVSRILLDCNLHIMLLYMPEVNHFLEKDNVFPSLPWFFILLM